MPVDAGDLFVLSTDGLLESRNHFGKDMPVACVDDLHGRRLQMRAPRWGRIRRRSLRGSLQAYPLIRYAIQKQATVSP